MEDLPGPHLRRLSMCALGSRCYECWCSNQYGGIDCMPCDVGHFRSQLRRRSVCLSQHIQYRLHWHRTDHFHSPYYLSLFYQRRELAFRTSLLLGMSPLANCFAGALAYGITQIRGSLEPWRLLFIIEGAPTVLFGLVVYFFLPDSPGTASCLTEHEQTLAVERMQTRDRTEKSKVHWKQFLAGAIDYRNFVHTFIHFMCNYSFAALSNFLPTIVQNMGYSSVNAQGLTAPIYLVSFLCCVCAALISDRYGARGLVIMISASVGTLGYLLLAILEDEKYNSVRYFAVWLSVCGVFPALCINVSIGVHIKRIE